MTILPPVLTPKNRRLPFLLITLLTFAVLVVSVISLVSGELTVFQNLFYFPIILACVYYVKRGFVFSVILACSYFFLMLIFSQNPTVLRDAAIRVLFFILVAGVITYLSIVRIRTEDALRESGDKIHLLLDSTAEAIYGIDMNANCTFCNSACLRLLGYKRPDELLGKNMHWQIHSKHLDGSPLPVEECRMIQGFHNGKGVHVDDEVFWRSDDTSFPTEYWSYPILRDGVVTGAVVTFLDITDRKRAEEETQRERAFLDRLVESAPEGIAITDTQGRVMRVNAEFVRMFGYELDEAVGQDIDNLVAPLAREEEAREISKSTNQGNTTFFETVRRRKDGSLVDVSVIAAPVLIGGKPKAVYAIYRDITERKQMEQKLEEMATHDFLTGLPNRRLLLDRFTIAAALAHRNKARIAVMSLDLDKFKSINDTLGHDAGDRVLKVISVRLVRILRASDTFARVGGDEFISVMMETDHIEEATAIANKILDSFTEPLSIAGHQLHLSTSIGIAIYPDDAEDLETLTKKSDAAMYYSKSHGRNQFKFYGDGDVQIS
jgi:diguanylate cyclase (GGDEF)-like protein/PAS domain S-box-containing protein